jgi:hypothetical protein
MSMPMTFQRIGSVSNAHVGRDFEDRVRDFFAAKGLALSKNYAVPVGHGNRMKTHRFDLGSEQPKVLIECKSHRWTTGGNSPSAKLTVWNEAMYYFHLAPANYRKILVVLSDPHERTAVSLAAHYLKNYGHLVPDGVEIWEFDAVTGRGVRTL